MLQFQMADMTIETRACIPRTTGKVDFTINIP